MKERIAGYRKMLGLTQKEMAAKFGISSTAYIKKEHGKTPFTDKEKVLFRDMVKDIDKDITIEKIFFSEDIENTGGMTMINEKNRDIIERILDIAKKDASTEELLNEMAKSVADKFETEKEANAFIDELLSVMQLYQSKAH